MFVIAIITTYVTLCFMDGYATGQTSGVIDSPSLVGRCYSFSLLTLQPRLLLSLLPKKKKKKKIIFFLFLFLFIQGRLNNLSYCLDRGLEFTAPSRFSVGLASARFPLVVPVYSSLRSAPHTRGVTRPLRINGPPRLAT